MARETNMVLIDGNKLDAIIRLKGLQKEEMSIEAGYNKKYISDVVGGNGKIKKSLITYLDLKYGIRYEDIKIDETKMDDKPAPESNADFITVTSKIDELIMAVNNLAKIESQNSELLKEIRNCWK